MIFYNALADNSDQVKQDEKPLNVGRREAFDCLH